MAVNLFNYSSSSMKARVANELLIIEKTVYYLTISLYIITMNTQIIQCQGLRIFCFYFLLLRIQRNYKYNCNLNSASTQHRICVKFQSFSLVSYHPDQCFLTVAQVFTYSSPWSYITLNNCNKSQTANPNNPITTKTETKLKLWSRLLPTF